MKGLLLKEYYMTLKYCRLFLLIVAVFFVVSFWADDTVFLMAYPLVMIGMIPVTLLAYDEKERWTLYSLTLPCTRSQMVSSKYLYGMLVELIAWLLATAVQTVKLFQDPFFTIHEYLFLLAAMFLLGFIGPSLILPIIIRFGTEKGRIIYIFVFVVLGVTVLNSEGFGPGTKLSAAIAFLLNHQWLYALLIIAALIIYGISWGISILLYQSKEV
ncbi:MAG: ABC-2 transporter permease [Lachnospiraceae bacterium]|nr:ABC-2 transporter permease [Lachnospiraceae bacterium]